MTKVLSKVLQLWFTNVRNKLECLSLTGISNPVKCLWVRQGAWPRVEHLKGASSLRHATLLTRAIYTRLERLPRDKHPSLLWTFM